MTPLPTRDYYEVLGVSRTADENEIKKAWRKLARELHPDVNTDDPEAEDRFKEAAEAYEVLSDPDRRQTYDRYGHDGLRSGGFSPDFDHAFASVSDLFGAFFGGGGFDAAFGGGRGRPHGSQGGDVAVAVTMSFADSAKGASVEVGYDAITRCEACNGNGAQPGTPIETCPTCRGVGQIQNVSRTRFGQLVRTGVCPSCQGEGRMATHPCESCSGRGRKPQRRTISIDVPPGIADGQRIRLTGRGHDGERGGPPGDLYVVVRVEEDPRFIRDGLDLVTVIDVPAPVAALGARVSVPTLEDDREVDLPAGTQPGDILVLPGCGMPPLHGGRHGDLRAVVNVVIPRKLSREQRELMERLAETMADDNGAGEAPQEGMLGKLRRLLSGHQQ